MHLFLLMFIMVLNVALPCSKLSILAFLFEIFETFLCLLLFSYIIFFRVLDMHQLQILFAKILIYLENKSKNKLVPLHATEALEGRGDIAPIHS
jgi:hypothetical protein